jgi:hypothetical protein
MLKNLSYAREADKVGTETESSTLTSSYTDRRRDQVENSEDGGGDEGEGGDFIERELVTGDEHSGTSYDKTFN